MVRLEADRLAHVQQRVDQLRQEHLGVDRVQSQDPWKILEQRVAEKAPQTQRARPDRPTISVGERLKLIIFGRVAVRQTDLPPRSPEATAFVGIYSVLRREKEELQKHNRSLDEEEGVSQKRKLRLPRRRRDNDDDDFDSSSSESKPPMFSAKELKFMAQLAREQASPDQAAEVLDFLLHERHFSFFSSYSSDLQNEQVQQALLRLVRVPDAVIKLRALDGLHTPYYREEVALQTLAEILEGTTDQARQFVAHRHQLQLLEGVSQAELLSPAGLAYASLLDDPQHAQLIGYVFAQDRSLWSSIVESFSAYLKRLLEIEGGKDVVEKALGLYKAHVAVELPGRLRPDLHLGTLQELQNPLLDRFLADTNWQETVALLASLTGRNVVTLQELVGRTDAGRTKGVLELLDHEHASDMLPYLVSSSFHPAVHYSSDGDRALDKLQLDRILSNQTIVEVMTDPDLYVFLDALHAQDIKFFSLGFTDQFRSPNFVEIFSDEQRKQQLLQLVESQEGIAVVKAFSEYFSDQYIDKYYLTLTIPHGTEMVSTLRGLGAYFVFYLQTNEFEAVLRNPGVEQVLTDGKLQDRIKDIASSFPKLEIKTTEDLLALAKLVDEGLAERVFSDKTKALFAHLIDDNRTIAAAIFLAENHEVIQLEFISTLIKYSPDFRFSLDRFEELVQLQGEFTLEELDSVLTKLHKIDPKYHFSLTDATQLRVARDLTLEKAESLRQMIEQMKLGINIIPNLGELLFINDNLPTVARLQKYGLVFHFYEAPLLHRIVESPDRERIFTVLDILHDRFALGFSPQNVTLYEKLARVENIEAVLAEAETRIHDPNEFKNFNNLLLFANLEGNVALYEKAKRLLANEYFVTNRDAKVRLSKLLTTLEEIDFPTDLFAKIVSLSGKATDLDRLALQLVINYQIAKGVGATQWGEELLHANTVQQAREALRVGALMLAIPAIYADLAEGEQADKRRKLSEATKTNQELERTIEISSLAVGIYGAIYPNRGREYMILMEGLRKAIELNLQHQGQEYLTERAALSAGQFDRVFEGVDAGVRELVLKAWFDIQPSRILRLHGDEIVGDDAVYNRLLAVKSAAATDLRIHFATLAQHKMEALRTLAERGDASAQQQMQVFSKYLEGGELPSDLVAAQAEIEANIAPLRETMSSSSGDRGTAGRMIGTYTLVGEILSIFAAFDAISRKKVASTPDYVGDTARNLDKLLAALKKLKILDPENLSRDQRIRESEQQLATDFDGLRQILHSEEIVGQVDFQTHSTVSFVSLATAPDMTNSCQRLTEQTGYNHAAISRILDGVNEMVETRDRGKMVARTFAELTRIRLTEAEDSILAVLLDREYVDPQYTPFTNLFTREIVLHMISRLESTQDVPLLLGGFSLSDSFVEELRTQGYSVRLVSPDIFINQSDVVPLAKYYDSFRGVHDVSRSSEERVANMILIEKVQ